MAAGLYSATLALLDVRSILPMESLLIPLCARQKKPSFKGWANLSGPGDLLAHSGGIFEEESGIGLVCGQPSGGLCFLDVDDTAAIEWFEQRVPSLSMAHQIIGARGCKWLVRVSESVRGFALRGPGGTRIGEFLGLRQQGVVAGIHPATGCPYSWHLGSCIPEIDLAFLKSNFSNYHSSEVLEP
jgi:hypothetical protein